MDRCTVAQRVEIVKIHYKNGEVFAETMRKVRTAFGRRQAPSRSAVVKIINKFERLGQVTDVKVVRRARKARTAENIAAVAESLTENRDVSISKRSKELGLSATTLRRILNKDLGLKNEIKRDDEHDDKRDEKLLRSNDCVFIGGAVPDFM